MNIQKQIVVTRARGNYMSEDRDKIDSQMHFENADTMEAMLKVVEAARNVLSYNNDEDRMVLRKTLDDLEQP